MATLVSSAIVNVDVGVASKTVLLPLAVENIGRSFYIRDLSGCASFSQSITISTISGNVIENSLDFLTITGSYGFYRLYAQNTSNYSIIGGTSNITNWGPAPGPGPL